MYRHILFYVASPVYTYCLCIRIYLLMFLIYDKSVGYCHFYLRAYLKPPAEHTLKVIDGQYCIM